MTTLRALFELVMSWYDGLPRWLRKTIDQVLHTLEGMAWSGIVTYWWPWWACWIFAAVCGGLREAFQNWGDEDNDYVDMAIDLTFRCLVGPGLWAALSSLIF